MPGKMGKGMVVGLVLGFGLVGCQQMPGTKSARTDGADGTFEPERQEAVPIEKELAAPKGFFRTKSEPFGGWSSQAREIEKSLGVNK
ncbi:MAG: hypothetical protein DWI24_10395 [Planctomycetota bacterium]|nr:MAG: hypothetical protein DWI24_10395 [Planctomycetota bacterium]